MCALSSSVHTRRNKDVHVFAGYSASLFIYAHVLLHVLVRLLRLRQSHACQRLSIPKAHGIRQIALSTQAHPQTTWLDNWPHYGFGLPPSGFVLGCVENLNHLGIWDYWGLLWTITGYSEPIGAYQGPLGLILVPGSFR